MRPGLHQRAGDGLRAGLAAEDDDNAQLRRVAASWPKQRRHRVEHGDASVVENVVGQLVGLAHDLRRRDEQRRADEIGSRFPPSTGRRRPAPWKTTSLGLLAVDLADRR